MKDRAWKNKKPRNRVLKFLNEVGGLKSAFYLILSQIPWSQKF